MKTTTQAAIGRALGLSKGAVSKLKARGMPVHSSEAARAWRREHLNPARRKPEPRPTGDESLRRVAELAGVAQAAVDAVRFELIEPALRSAMRDVPSELRERVALPVPVWDALLRPMLALIGSEPNAGEPRGADMSDNEAELMGSFWYSVAAEEPVGVP